MCTMLAIITNKEIPKQTLDEYSQSHWIEIKEIKDEVVDVSPSERVFKVTKLGCSCDFFNPPKKLSEEEKESLRSLNQPIEPYETNNIQELKQLFEQVQRRGSLSVYSYTDMGYGIIDYKGARTIQMGFSEFLELFPNIERDRVYKID